MRRACPGWSLRASLKRSIQVLRVSGDERKVWGRAMKKLRITIGPHAAESEKAFIREGLGLYSVAKTGCEEYYPVAVFLRDASNEVLGGILGEIWGEWMYVSHVWLAAPLRRGGYGSKLLAAVEQYALEK